MKNSNIEMMKTDIDFYKMIDDAFKKELPFVTYRKPNDYLVKGVFQKNSNLYYTKNYQESGFIFAPFDNKDSSILFPIAQSTLYNSEFVESHFDDEKSNKSFVLSSETSKDEHIALVKDGIRFLENNNFKKVVLSRKETLELEECNVVETFKKLLSNYKNAFVYCWFHPKVGLWFGATPETLLKVKENTFSTMALAGTQVYNPKNQEVNWKVKEKEEQRYVTDFILEQLNKFQFEGPEIFGKEQKNFIVSKPYTIKTGNLLHLRTDIKGQLTENLTLKRIINLLHPTPAVCGVPKQEAKDFILQSENYDRQFYTGFLGELNVDNTSNLFVNLRCMQVLKSHIEIYIGGGITKDSIPLSEWEETIAKSKVMMRVF